jgi:hypothetical protein
MLERVLAALVGADLWRRLLLERRAVQSAPVSPTNAASEATSEAASGLARIKIETIVTASRASPSGLEGRRVFALCRRLLCLDTRYPILAYRAVCRQPRAHRRVQPSILRPQTGESGDLWLFQSTALSSECVTPQRQVRFD